MGQADQGCEAQFGTVRVGEQVGACDRTVGLFFLGHAFVRAWVFGRAFVADYARGLDFDFNAGSGLGDFFVPVSLRWSGRTGAVALGFVFCNKDSYTERGVQRRAHFVLNG